jgi:predicted double-glycine peptidase
MLKLIQFRQTPGFCGPASLKIVLDYFGIKKSEKELARLAGCTKEQGASSKGILKAAKALGFNGFIKDFAGFSGIKKLVLEKKIPVIVNWFSIDEGHYSVVAGINAKKIFLQDPELGHLRPMKLESFKRTWFDFHGKFPKTKKSFVLRRMIVICQKKK